MAVTVDAVVDDRVHTRRWAILAVLCLSLLVVGIDGTIANVALPTLVRELDASSSDLQWIVDAYTIVFASLLLVAGNAGDRRGRKKTLIDGLIDFGALVGEAGRDTGLATSRRERLVEPRRAALREMIARAVARGELDAGTDADLLADLLAGPLFHRLVITGEPVNAATGHELATLVADRVGAPG